jgi:DNA invertase Pin-like site-specific DNA recombinase
LEPRGSQPAWEREPGFLLRSPVAGRRIYEFPVSYANVGAMTASDSQTPGRVLGYARVSTSSQAVSGYGLGVQQAAIEQACIQRDLTLVELLVDGGVSGSKVGPRLTQALARLDAGEADYLMVSKLDRMARSTLNGAKIIERAQKHGWGIIALDMGLDMSTNSGRFMVNLFLAVAEFERGLISERTKAALGQARSQGVVLGRHSQTIPPEVGTRIVRERTQGQGWVDIAARLNAESVPTPRGGRRWYPATVRNYYNTQAGLALDALQQAQRQDFELSPPDAAAAS